MSLVGQQCDACKKPFCKDGAWSIGFEHYCDDCAIERSPLAVQEAMRDFCRERTKERSRSKSDG